MQLDDILKLNFRDANNLFADPNHPMKVAYIMAQKQNNNVYDLRGTDAVVLDELIGKHAFILLCGMSGTGKTTLAKSIKEKFGKKRVEVLDIDQICIKWLKEKERTMSPANFEKFMQNFDANSDEYVFENLENMVAKASVRGSKAVILVAGIVELLPRSIFMHTLGEKYFPYCATIFLYESPEVLEKRLKQRDGVNYRVGVEQFRKEALVTVLHQEVVAWASDVGYIANSTTRWIELQ